MKSTSILWVIAFGLTGCCEHPFRQLRQGGSDVPKHPALATPDGESHRSRPMVAAEVKDSRVLEELARKYRTEQDFERRQEYFLRLLDHYLVSQNRLIGKSREQIEKVFGAGEPDLPRGDMARLTWSGGRDLLVVDFKGDRAVGAMHVQGY